MTQQMINLQIFRQVVNLPSEKLIWMILGTVRSENGWSPSTVYDQPEKEFQLQPSMRMQS